MSQVMRSWQQHYLAPIKSLKQLILAHKVWIYLSSVGRSYAWSCAGEPSVQQLYTSAEASGLSAQHLWDSYTAVWGHICISISGIGSSFGATLLQRQRNCVSTWSTHDDKHLPLQAHEKTLVLFDSIKFHTHNLLSPTISAIFEYKQTCTNTASLLKHAAIYDGGLERKLESPPLYLDACVYNKIELTYTCPDVYTEQFLTKALL
jgi:hypothetical protein